MPIAVVVCTVSTGFVYVHDMDVWGGGQGPTLSPINISIFQFMIISLSWKPHAMHRNVNFLSNAESHGERCGVLFKAPELGETTQGMRHSSSYVALPGMKYNLKKSE